MIAKPYTNKTLHLDRRQRAGAAAENQMAHYLHRAFKQDREVHVFHALRIQDAEQPEQDGSPGVCQIDHLVVHRWGMFVVESKSVTQEVRVCSDGSGGDEWSRVYRGEETGMASPIRQARRQAEFLRAFLQSHRERLLGREQVGLRTLARVVRGTDQRGFANVPIQLMIAVSDGGRIRRLNGWKEPEKPFRVFVSKADLIPSKIGEELERHRKGSNLLGKPQGSYGLWSMEEAEAAGVAEFLVAQHVERTGDAAPKKKEPGANSGRRLRGEGSTHDGENSVSSCRHCGARDLTARWGKFGYYWRCGACGGNTAMPVVCSACGAKGRRGEGIRVRKEGRTYFRDCNKCGATETIWTEA